MAHGNKIRDTRVRGHCPFFNILADGCARSMSGCSEWKVFRRAQWGCDSHCRCAHAEDYSIDASVRGGTGRRMFCRRYIGRRAADTSCRILRPLIRLLPAGITGQFPLGPERRALVHIAMHVTGAGRLSSWWCVSSFSSSRTSSRRPCGGWFSFSCLWSCCLGT